MTMKTMRSFLTTLLVTSCFTVFGQYNPINNLYFEQIHLCVPGCPSANCFELSWSPPDSSSDTLKGYNIYRNNVLWIFTNLIEVSCMGMYPCDYPDIWDNIPFWISVKAVYNNDSIESQAVDSVYIQDILIDIKNNKIMEFTLLNNPVKPGDNISLLIPYIIPTSSVIQITSQEGQFIKSYVLKSVSNSIINISTNHMSSGIYYIYLQIDNKLLTKKIIIE